MRRVAITDTVAIGSGAPLLLVAGPCVIESEDLTLQIASEVTTLADRLGIGFVFKASFDKANRTSLGAFRGPNLDRGLEILGRVKHEVGAPVLTDIHEPGQAKPVAEVADVLQIPAFLSRQTDLLLAAAATGRTVNVKKGQFLAPWDMAPVVEKLEGGGTSRVLVTERGTTFGYNNLVVDFRSLVQLRELGYPVIFDGTHSVQTPGGRGTSSGGDRRYVPGLCRAAVATGVDGIFLEVHPDPDTAPSDGPNMLPVNQLESLLQVLLQIRRASSG